MEDNQGEVIVQKLKNLGAGLERKYVRGIIKRRIKKCLEAEGEDSQSAYELGVVLAEIDSHVKHLRKRKGGLG